MNKLIISFLLTSIAGLTTLIGYFIVFLRCDQKKIISFSLAFSGSVMLTISFLDLIREAINYLNYYNFFFRSLLIIFFISLGFFTSNYISYRFDNDNNLKTIGIISLIAIIIHNIPEGIITFIVSGININLGIELALAISMHNIPEGISIAVPLFYATNNKIKTFFVVLIASLSEIVGALICYLFLQNLILKM